MAKAPYQFKPLVTETRPNGVPILMALQRLGRHIYDGSVPRDVIARRRLRNKIAKASRKKNRRG